MVNRQQHKRDAVQKLKEAKVSEIEGIVRPEGKQDGSAPHQEWDECSLARDISNNMLVHFLAATLVASCLASVFV